MTGSLDRRGLDAWAYLRLGFIPVVLVGERWAGPEQQPVFFVTLALAAAYAFAVWLLQHSGFQPRLALLAAADAALLCVLIYETGGPGSQVRKALFVVPFAAAFIGTPRQTVGWSLFAVAASLAVSLPHPEADGLRSAAPIFVHSIYLAWAGLGAVLLSLIAEHRNREVRELADAQTLLAAQVLSAEDEAYKRIAYSIHDEAIQTILAGLRDLDRVEAGDDQAVPRVRTALREAVESLRDVTAALHPYALEYGGLGPALEQLTRSTQDAGFAVELRVASDAEGRADQLAYSLVRELVRNAEKHSDATRLTVSVTASSRAIHIEVEDDGRGMLSERPTEALFEGHIGIASVRERAQAAGGTFELFAMPGDGVRVAVTIPSA